MRAALKKRPGGLEVKGEMLDNVKERVRSSFDSSNILERVKRRRDPHHFIVS
jgi:hypothetical protein